MCGIERKCNECNKWLAPSQFERYRKKCRACRNACVMERVRASRPPPEQALSCVVSGTPQEQAAAIAGAAGDGQIFAYRFHTGSVTWRRKAKGPEGAEFLGCYNPGCDYRQIVQDLQAA